MISDLVCQVQTPAGEDGYYTAEFSFRYFDDDADLGGGVIEWWLDDVPQSDLFPNAELGTTGTITLSLDGFPDYERLAVRFQAVDATGNASNLLYADMVTIPGSESCVAATGDEGE